MDSATLNRRLENFSKELKPSDEFFKLGNDTADRIFQLLKKSKSFKVDRVKISGSIGKNSAVCVDPDYDLVVFVNDEKPIFKDVLNNFEDILRMADMDIKNIKVTRFSIQFDVNGISFDLLPATNFVTQYPQPGGPTLAQIQADGAMRFIKKNPGVGYKYGSSVCELQIEFLKNQSTFVHQVVRLAKFWNKTLNMGTYISGRSTMIELIGIHAAKIHEARGELSSLEGFKTFLQLMSNFETISVKFCDFYFEHEIPWNVKDQHPLVLDPVNPYNNFAYFRGNMKAKIIEKFNQFAENTLDRMNNCKDLDDLFQVQPKVFVPGPQPGKWLIGSESNDLNLVNPRMKVRISDEEFKKKARGVREMQQCLLTTLGALTLDGRGVAVDDVKKRIEECIDLNILGLPSKRGWITMTDRHEDQNVTLRIPIPGYPGQCIVLSASW